MLRRVAAGEVELFSGLVERHQQRILALCRRMLLDAEEARDAAQEVFLRAYRNAGSYQPRGQVFTWLYRIAVNYCLNRLRRRHLARFVPLLGSGGEAGIEPADPGLGASASLETRQRWRALRASIQRLPPGQRAVLVLAKFEGLSYREIAAALGISEGAVESRLVRAMRSLTAADAAFSRGESDAQEG